MQAVTSRCSPHGRGPEPAPDRPIIRPGQIYDCALAPAKHRSVYIVLRLEMTRHGLIGNGYWRIMWADGRSSLTVASLIMLDELISDAVQGEDETGVGYRHDEEC